MPTRALLEAGGEEGEKGGGETRVEYERLEKDNVC